MFKYARVQMVPENGPFSLIHPTMLIANNGFIKLQRCLRHEKGVMNLWHRDTTRLIDHSCN